MADIKAKRTAFPSWRVSKQWRQAFDVGFLGTLAIIAIVLMNVLRRVTETVDQLRIIAELLR
jgi:hypothetical protein